MRVSKSHRKGPGHRAGLFVFGDYFNEFLCAAFRQLEPSASLQSWRNTPARVLRFCDHQSRLTLQLPEASRLDPWKAQQLLSEVPGNV